MASEVLPDPDTPTTATVRHSGTSTSISRRLLRRAPRTLMAAGSVCGTGISPGVIPGNLMPFVGWGGSRPGPAPERSPARPGARCSGVNRSAVPAVQAVGLHDLERRGGGELRDVRGGQHAGVLRDDRRGGAFHHRVEMALDPGPHVRPG